MARIRKFLSIYGCLVLVFIMTSTWLLVNNVVKGPGSLATQIQAIDIQTYKTAEENHDKTKQQDHVVFPARPTTQIPWEEMMEQRHQQRSQRVIDQCRRSGLYRAELYEASVIGEHVVVSLKHKMMWCIVPKVGSSQWKHVMAKVERLKRIPQDIFTRAGFKFFNNFPPTQQKEMLRTFHKFMFVRHPLERLLSAFRDKFEKKSPAFLKIFGRTILREYRPNATTWALETGEGVTFPEFAKYVANLRRGYFDYHWRPFYRQCHACVIPYDYIGHFETYKEDADYILKRAGVDHLVTFPPFYGSNTSSELYKYYAGVPRDTIIKLIQTYHDDLEMFGYPFPGSLRSLMN